MLSNIEKLGKPLNIKEQKAINGGRKPCDSHTDCGPGFCCGYLTSVCVTIYNTEGLCAFYPIDEPDIEQPL